MELLRCSELLSAAVRLLGSSGCCQNVAMELLRFSKLLSAAVWLLGSSGCCQDVAIELLRCSESSAAVWLIECSVWMLWGC